MEILIQACQLILSLSILVLLHELGHFIPAKLFKTRVEKFYLFFDPWFSVFKKKVGDTEYGLGWLPLGGYVKISGMIDESMDKEQMKRPAEPWEFRAKPAWQRLIIMAGGVFVNLVLGVLIYSMVLAVWGDSYISNEKLVVSDSESNEEILKSVLIGSGQKSHKDVVALNSALVLWVAGIEDNLHDGFNRALFSINQGNPWKKFLLLKTYLSTD